LRIEVTLAAILCAACNDQPTGPTQTTLEVVQTPSAVGAPGWELIDPIKVRVVDAAGVPQPGFAVSWSVREGGGSVATTSEATDSEGVASAVWTLGARAGPNSIRASLVGGDYLDLESVGEAFKVDLVATDGYMACGLVSAAVWCWGSGSFVPHGAPPSRGSQWAHFDESPSLLSDERGYVDVAVAGSSVCALDDQGQAWCAVPSQPELAQPAGLPKLHQFVGSGWEAKFCGLAASDSTAWCWRLGGVPAHVVDSPAFRRIWMNNGGATICGLLADSTAACWGSGDGADASSDVPVAVGGGHRFTELAVASAYPVGYACGLKGNGEVWCWEARYAAPTPLDPMPTTDGAFRLAADWSDMQVILAGGEMIRWRGTTFTSLQTPTGVEDRGPVEFATNSYACVLLASREVYCYEDMWNNSSGIYDDIYSPVQPRRQ